MPFRALKPHFVAFLTILFAACSSSGGGSEVVGPDCANGDPNAFCLTTCNLGCSLSGCSINAIAQNQPIFLQFNQDIDPNSVNSGSVSLRTATGEEPQGRLVVNGPIVQFVPDVLISGSQTFFGFKANATYGLFLPSGQSVNVLRSTSGDRLAGSISCSLQVTRGIIDLNEACPQASLVTPSNRTSAPTDTVIVLRFNEILDPAPFIGANEQNKPIRFFARKTEPQGNPPVFVCRTNSAATELAGPVLVTVDSARQQTVVRFQPQEELPGRTCVEIVITPKVKDLAGVEACPQTLSFVTEDLGVQERKVIEDFSTDSTLDAGASAGTWSNNKLTFAKIGGDGVLGEFNPEDGTGLGNDVWEWSTDGDTTIPRTATLDGVDHTIMDGVFSFSTFVVPAGTTVNFVGKFPVQINVRGEMKIQGKLLCNGVDIKKDAHKGLNNTGELGGLGGPGGAAGGKGGDKGDGVANKANFNGQNGKTMVLPGSHAYAVGVSTTGGVGSKQYPANGKQSAIKFSLFGVISVMATPGGGGGGNLLPGGRGIADWVDQQGKPHVDYNKEIGPAPDGGTALGWDAVKPTNADSLKHHQAGGSGGGGAGTHPLGTIDPGSGGEKISFNSGRGGAGGGGALAIRCGHQLTVTSTGLIQARGGNASPNLSRPFTDGDPSAGGGGSAGTIFIQVDGVTSMLGLMDVSGGQGGELKDQPTAGDEITIKGGDGSPGIIRLETVGVLNKQRLGITTPSGPGPNGEAGREVKNSDVQLLTDQDTLVGLRSRWYATSLAFSPDFVRYEIEAKVDGSDVVYSDDPKVGTLAVRGSTPVFFLAQGVKVRLSAAGVVEPIPGHTPTPWRSYVGPFSSGKTLNDDNATGFRFTIVLDRSFGKAVEIKKITVLYRL